MGSCRIGTDCENTNDERACREIGGEYSDEPCGCTGATGPSVVSGLIQNRIARDLGDDPETWSLASGTFHSLRDARDLLSGSEVGQRIITYNSSFTEEAVAIAQADPELSRDMVRAILIAGMFFRAMEREAEGRGAGPGDPPGRFTQELFEWSINVAARVRNATTNADLIAALDDVQEEVRRFVGLLPREALELLQQR